MASISKSSNDSMVRCTSHPHAPPLAGTLPKKRQCLANSDDDAAAAAAPCTPCIAATPPTLVSNECHVSQPLQGGTAYDIMSANRKTSHSLETTQTLDGSSSKLLPENDSVDGLSEISDVSIIECDSVSAKSIEPRKLLVPLFKKKLSRRKHSLLQNCSLEKKDSTILPEEMPCNLSTKRKRKHNLPEQNDSHKEDAKSNFSLSNVKTEPEELDGHDSLANNSYSNTRHKKKKASKKLDVLQENLRSEVSSAISNFSVESVIIKPEPVEEPLYEMPCASSTNDPLADNIKIEHNEDSINPTQLLDDVRDDSDSTVISTGKKKANHTSKYMINGYNIISNLVHNLRAPVSIIDGAFTLFNKVVNYGVLRGRATALIASSCVYFVCRQDGVPRTFQEIVAISNVSKKELGRCFKLILKGLDTSLTIIKTDDFMCRFCHALGLGDEVVEAAECIAKAAARMDLVPGRSPVSVASAAIYMAAQASEAARTTLEISKATGISESTVLVVYRSIYPYAKELFPPDFKFRKSIENLTTTRLLCY